MAYEYKMIQIPPTIEVKEKEYLGQEAAVYLQHIINEQADKGWDFYRVDTVGIITRPGCLSALFASQATPRKYYVVTFRKQKMS